MGMFRVTRSNKRIRRWLVALSTVAMVMAVLPTVALAADPVGDATATQWTDTGPGIVHKETGVPGEDVYIVLHQAPSLAQYAGEVPGLVATSPAATGASRLDAGSAASIAYLDYLALQHSDLQTSIEDAIGRDVDVKFRYDAVLNGMAVVLTPAEALVVSSLSGVRHVERDSYRELQTDNGPRWIGADTVWGEDPVSGTTACEGTCGEGIVAGVIDTGVNHDHPSFAAVGGDGYVHSNPRATFYGACDPLTGAPFCNDKLIGFYDFTGTGPEDDNGHGSHTSSTTAGNVLSAVLQAPTITVTRDISGVAPHANLISYKGCSGTPVGCLISALLASINQATLDGVDVINYSIGGNSSDPWSDLDAQAFFDSYTAGIFVATSASNDGPGFGTLGSPADAPWVTSVGASTHDRLLANGVVNMTNADLTPGPADIFGASLTAPLPAAHVVYAGDYASQSSDPANAHLCGAGVGDPATGEGSGGDPFPPGTFNGEIVVCDRGEYGRVHKGDNVLAGGAGGFVLANDAANGGSLVGDAYALPGVHISYDDGVILKAWIAANGGVAHQGTAEINGSNPDVAPENADIMASFSSRGANPAAPSLVKPDVTAPGVDILAAWMTPAGTLPGGDPEFDIISGTSMSSPHTAGAGALVLAAHPDWTPDEVKSALMTTAFSTLPGTGGEVHGVFKEDGVTPADPFDMGAGRIDLNVATKAGLVFGETAANYTAANPSTGGDPTTLNIASFGNDACDETCSWTRTVTSTTSAPVTWTATVDNPAGSTLTVSPASFVLVPGIDSTFEVTADVSAAAAGWNFGTVTLTPSDPTIPTVNLPVALQKPGGGDPLVPPTTLHLHGNVHDEGCTGDGRADLIACDGPFLSDDPVLDTAAPAKFGPVSPALDGTNSRNIYDPNWIWHVAETATIEGPMTVKIWTSCGACASGVFTANWDVRVFDTDAAGAVPVVETTVIDATPVAPNVPSLIEFTVDLPNFQVASALVLQIDPVYIDSQQNTTIYYDSAVACGSDPLVPCDSVVLMPIIDGGGVNRPPQAVSDSADVDKGGSVNIDVLANDSDPDGDPITLDSFTNPTNGTLVDNGGGSFTYTHNDGDSLSDSFTYVISDDKGLEATGTVTITVVGSALTLKNSFVSAVGWVKPGEGYPFRVIVENPTGDDASNVEVNVELPDGTTFLMTTEDAGSAAIAGDITWTIPSLAAGATATMVVQAQADSQAQDLRIVWKNLSSTATLAYDGGPLGIMSMSHGPKVIPTDSTFDSARYGDRPFPVVPVDWFDRKHEPEHTAELLSAKLNSPDVPGSTFNLFQEMSLGQLFPAGTVPSSGIATADFSGQAYEFTDPQPSGACTGTTFKDLAGSPVYDERISNGWYQMPGDTNYYGADKFTFAGSIGGAQVGLGPLLQIDDACGPTGKAVYDAAHIADPEIDYNDFDTDKDGVVDFFMMVFVGLGGNGDSQINGVPPYDNIWPHSSSLEFYFTDADTGLKGYVSNDQLKSLDGVPQCWVSAAYQESDDCAADGGLGLDTLPVFVRVGPYNVNPEEAIERASVISHEYGHSLGLPDFYSLGSRSTYGDWNLMATDKSQNMDIFSKQELGWIVPQVLQPGDSFTATDWTDSKLDTGEIQWVDPNGDPYTLSAANGDQKVHNADAWQVKLPSRKVIEESVVANGASLDHVWWSGSGNDFGSAPLGGRNLDIYIPELAGIDPGDSVELRFKTNFDIEWDYDYGFVLYSTDFGATYTSLESASGYTDPASQNPNANGCQAQYGNGISGTTTSRDGGAAVVATDRVLGNYPANTGFTQDTYDLSAAAGSETVVRFSYATDPGLARPGWFIDDVEVVVNGTDVVYSSDFEDGANEDRIFNGGCQGEGGRVAQTCTSGWKYINASAGSPADHAYYLEMRDRSGFDVDGMGENDRTAIAFQPGVLLVYTDETHGYGNVGTDDPPAQSPVDSRPQPLNNTPNLNDAAFKTGDVYFDDGSSMLGTQANLNEPGWTDNYEAPGPSDKWVHDFGCLSFTVDALSGTDVAAAYNLIGDVTFDLGDGCRTFDYGNGNVVPNIKPTAVAQVRPTVAGVGEDVTFDGSASYDQETASADLGYEWDFGDGSPTESGATLKHAYGAPGTYTATLTVTDEAGATDTDTVEVEVSGNGRPEANDDTAATPEDTPVDIDVLANDTDPDGDTLTIVSVEDPLNGTASIVGGEVRYEPDAGFSGTDTFNYTITDGQLDASALITVSVAPVNDDPVGVDDGYEVFEDQELVVAPPGVLGNDSDEDGDTLSAALDPNGPPSHGTVVMNADGSFTYTPDADYNGADQFAYIVSDGNGGQGSATVSITVRPVNDAPLATDDSASTTIDTPVTVDVIANDSDVDGDVLSVSSVTQPANGSAVDNGDGTVTYSPDAGFTGTDTFTYTVSDGKGGSDEATVTVNVVDDGGNGNTVPVGGGKVTGGGYLEPVAGKKINFGGNAKSDLDGTLTGNWTLQDKTVDVKIHIKDIVAIGSVANECGSVDAGLNSIEFWGTGTFNGAGATFQVCAQDNGEPGSSGSTSNPDAFYLACLEGCVYDTASRTSDDLIDGGNIQVHDVATDGADVDTGTGSKSSASGAQVLILDPMLTSEALIGSVTAMTVLAYDADGEPLHGVEVTLTSTAAGVANVTGVTAADGLVVFPVTALGGDIAYQASAGATVSNFVDITGIV